MSEIGNEAMAKIGARFTGRPRVIVPEEPDTIRIELEVTQEEMLRWSPERRKLFLVGLAAISKSEELE